MNDVSLYANCEDVSEGLGLKNEARGRGEGEGATNLLAEANAGPAVEGEEDERVGDEVLLHTLVEEPLRVKHERCIRGSVRHTCTV